MGDKTIEHIIRRSEETVRGHLIRVVKAAAEVGCQERA